MSKNRAASIGRPRALHRHAWLWEAFGDDPTFVLRSMFGTKATYLRRKLIFCSCDREEPWRGVLVGTEKEHHASLLNEFPELASHAILPKWLYLPETNAAFEKIAVRLLALAWGRDPRLGVTPRPKKKKPRSSPRSRP